VGPAGADSDKGAKYMILPPGYAEKPAGGYIVLPSNNCTGYGFLRSVLKSHSTIESGRDAGRNATL
jgi:hypothetical protein